MKKIIKNIIILIIFAILMIVGLFFLNEYIIGSQQIAQMFTPIYDNSEILISKNINEEKTQNQEGIIQTVNQKTDNINRYYYTQLDEHAKIIYNKISENKENMKSGNYTIDFGKTFNGLLNSENGEEKMNASYQSSLDAYLLDNTDVFYIDVTKLYLFINSRTVGRKTTYTVKIGAENGANYYAKGFNTLEEVNKAISNVETVASEMLSYTGENEYKNIKKMHDILVSNLSYEQTISKPNIRNIYGALCERQVVCEGYAKAYKYLLDKINIENIIVVGYGTNSNGNKEEHAWNYVKLNQNWYAVDVTWDDPIIIGGGKLTNKSKYKYFLKGAQNFNNTHEATGKTSQGGITFTYPELSIVDYE